MTDFDRLRRDELGSICEFVRPLSDEQWNHASLCEGWRVRDVIGHMALGYTTPMLPLLRSLAKYRFNVPRASAAGSVQFGNEHSPAELVATFDKIYKDDIRKGIARVISAKEALLDHLVHQQDMRRPLGIGRQIPEERLVAALSVAPGLGGFVGSKKRAAGLRLIATDVDWSHGDGPEVRGHGEAILLTLTGRSAAVGELSGEGVAALRGRLAA